MNITSRHIITFNSNKKCLGLCAILATQLSFPPVCAKRQGKQLYKMHRWQKLADTANNVLSSTLKFKCINYTNIGRDEPGKKGRKGGSNYQNNDLTYQHKSKIYNKSLGLTLPETEGPSDRTQ